MANQINDNKDLMRSVQEACDELDRKEMEKAILQKQKEDAEYVAKITTEANEELVREIRDLNYKSSLYGTTKKSLDLRDEEQHGAHVCNCPVCQQQRNQVCQHHECQCHNHECQCQHHDCIKNNQDVNIRVPFFKEHRALFFLLVGIVCILLLATGYTPTGGFWTAIQDQWITLIADIFKIALVGILGALVYNGVKK